MIEAGFKIIVIPFLIGGMLVAFFGIVPAWIVGWVKSHFGTLGLVGLILMVWFILYSIGRARYADRIREHEQD